MSAPILKVSCILETNLFLLVHSLECAPVNRPPLIWNPEVIEK